MISCSNRSSSVCISLCAVAAIAYLANKLYRYYVAIQEQEQCLQEVGGGVVHNVVSTC